MFFQGGKSEIFVDVIERMSVVIASNVSDCQQLVRVSNTNWTQTYNTTAIEIKETSKTSSTVLKANEQKCFMNWQLVVMFQINVRIRTNVFRICREF